MEENQQRDAPKAPKFTAKLDGRTNDRQLAEYLATKSSKSAWLEACAFIGMLAEMQKDADMIAKAAAIRDSRAAAAADSNHNQ